jgi:hypothetical protein
MTAKKNLFTLYWIPLLGLVMTATLLVMTATCISPPETAAVGNEETIATIASDINFDSDYAPHFMETALLGRPTDHSVVVNVVPAEDIILFVEYRNSTGTGFLRTPAVAAKAKVPQNMAISNLESDTGYTYHICYSRPGNTTIRCSPDYSFHTQRSPGSVFVFDVQADSHLDERSRGELYRSTLKNEQGDNPDFLIDLGDTFMTDKLPVKNNETFLSQYLQQRSYLSEIGPFVPIFLVLGNHDGEAGYALDGTAENIARLSLNFRKMYFPGPKPDGFYTGNSDDMQSAGLLQDYYAWEWGDALFAVLDPYWYTTIKPGRKTDGWGWTLGASQYQWLNRTLGQSCAKYKFVFAHQLVGGDPQGRGGTEYASLYEWGGKNPDGSWGFDRHRPGWGVPIHQLLVQNHVTAFFHGHDHFFAKQELDGVIYQEVPQPATMSSPQASPGAEYGYVSGEKLGSPGHLRITVSPESVQVDYIRSCLPGESRSCGKNGAIAYSYTLFSPLENVGGGPEGI